MPLSRRPTASDVEPDPWRELVANLQGGIAVEESFQRLFQEHYSMIMEFFRFRRFPPDESHDLAQETFLNVFRGIHTFRGDSSLRTWLLQVAANVWRYELRRRAASKRSAREIPLDDIGSNAEEEASLRLGPDNLVEDLLKAERRQLLLQELLKLPPQMRQCVLLRVLQDLKYHEIAAVMRISIQTVKSQLHQARQRLRETLEEASLHD